MDFNKIVNKLKEIDPSDIFNAHGTSASEKTTVTTTPKVMLKENDQLAILAGIKSEKQIITESATVAEVSPKGWEGTVKSMKKHKEIDNPWALSHWMKGKGYKSHKKGTNEGAISENNDQLMQKAVQNIPQEEMIELVDRLSNGELSWSEYQDAILSSLPDYSMSHSDTGSDDDHRAWGREYNDYDEDAHSKNQFSESWDDDDEDPDVAKADKELKKKGVKLPNVKVDPEKDMSKLAKKSKKDDDLDEAKMCSKSKKKVGESWDDDDEDPDVAKADKELKKKGIKLPKVKDKEVPIKKTAKDKEEELDESWDDDDEDSDVKKADSELKKRGIKLPKVKDKEVPIKKTAKDKEEELDEGAKPDYLDLDKDGNKKEPMKKAAKEKGKKASVSAAMNKVKESMTFVQAASIVKENIGSAQLDPLDETLWTWANKVANSKVEEGIASKAMAIKIYENFGGSWGVYLHESKI